MPQSKPKIKTSKYKKLIEASYLGNNNDAEKLGNTMNYKLDRDLSNIKQKVYTHNNKVVVAYQGTKPSRIRDLVSDGMLALGLEKYDPRFQEASKIMDRVKDKYGDKKIIAVGHSLGGSLAEYAGKKADRVITLDKGVGIGGINKKLDNKQTDIRASNDIVSGLALTQSGKRITIPNTQQIINPLASHDVKVLSRFDQNSKL